MTARYNSPAAVTWALTLWSAPAARMPKTCLSRPGR